MEGLISLNGKIVSSSEGKISVSDRGLLYGESVFESLRIYEGIPFLLDLHLKRLYESAHFLEFSLPFTFDEIENFVWVYLKKANLKEGFLRITLTSGNENLKGNFLIFTLNKQLPTSNDYKNGVKIQFSSYLKPNLFNYHSNLKTGNYLNSVLAKKEAQKNGFFESIFLSETEKVLECSNSNIFFINKNVLVTPALTNTPVLAGITRKIVLDLAKKMALPTSQRVISKDECDFFSECFVTNSFIGILPVTQIGKKPFGIGSVGSFTKLLSEKYQLLLEKEVELFRHKLQ
ncbi:aminotransferase class IV family protein [bacterium]|nr:aminotransferase class IV family protein [bacterium]